MLQTAVDAYYTKNNATFPASNAIVLNLSNATSKVKGQFTTNDSITNDAITLYEIDYALIGVDSLKYGRKQDGTNDVYAISRNSGKVYYAKGLKIGNDIYYTLTDDISNLLSYNSEKNTVNSPIVLFEPSQTDWTSNDVTIRIKIPTICEVVSSIKIINEDKTETTLNNYTEENGYRVYQATPVGNYSVEVSYKPKVTDTELKVAKYNVTNVDKVSPTIQIDKTNKVSMQVQDYLGYMKVTSTSDNLSGIKNIKYDYGDFVTSLNKEQIKTHFETTGENLEDNTIFIKQGYDKITIYIEDNAGNFYAEVLDATI